MLSKYSIQNVIQNNCKKTTFQNNVIIKHLNVELGPKVI